MKFGPGKTNQFVLIETRRDFLMWNMQDESIFSKMPKENVLAIDWISSDRMVFLEQEQGYSDSLNWAIPYGTASDLTAGDLSETRTPNNPSQADRSLKILNLELNIEVNTNQNTSMDSKKSDASFHEDLLSKIEELKTNDIESKESSDLEEFTKTKLLENLQEVLLKHNRKSDFIFMLLLQSMITKVFPFPVSLDNFRF